MTNSVDTRIKHLEEAIAIVKVAIGVVGEIEKRYRTNEEILYLGEQYHDELTSDLDGMRRELKEARRERDDD